MIRGTTPTHNFILPIDTNTIKCVRVTYAQNDKVILTKEATDCTLSGNTVSVKLTQEDTLALDCHYEVDIQVRALTLGNDALASDIYRVSVAKCLDGGVLE